MGRAGAAKPSVSERMIYATRALRKLFPGKTGSKTGPLLRREIGRGDFSSDVLVSSRQTLAVAPARQETKPSWNQVA